MSALDTLTEKIRGEGDNNATKMLSLFALGCALDALEAAAEVCEDIYVDGEAARRIRALGDYLRKQ